MPRASSPAVTAPAKRHGSGPPPLPCPPGPRCGSHGHLALRATAALPAGLPPLAQTLARAPTGSPPPALARRTFSKQSGSLCTTPGPSEAAPCSWPTGRPGANLTPCHTFLRHLLCIVLCSRPAHPPPVGSWVLPLQPGARCRCPRLGGTQHSLLLQRVCPFLEQGSRYWGDGKSLVQWGCPRTPGLATPCPSPPRLVPCSSFPPAPLLSEIPVSVCILPLLPQTKISQDRDFFSVLFPALSPALGPRPGP